MKKRITLLDLNNGHFRKFGFPELGHVTFYPYLATGLALVNKIGSICTIMFLTFLLSILVNFSDALNIGQFEPFYLLFKTTILYFCGLQPYKNTITVDKMNGDLEAERP
jgi:hypothetical protein